MCVVKNAAALGSDVGAAVWVAVGDGEGVGEAEGVADDDADGEGWVETAGAHTQAFRTRAVVTAIVRSSVTLPVGGLRAGGRAGVASSDSLRPEG